MKHYLVTLIFLSGVAGAHTAIQSAQSAAAKESPPKGVLDFPSTIGPYKQAGSDIEISQDVQDVLQTSLILMRTYVDPRGWPVQLTVIYAGASRRSLHFPEVCLVGQGWEIRDQSTHPVGFSFVATKLVLVRGNRQEAVLYWFKTGDQLTGNFFVNSWWWAKNQLMFGAPTSAMIKLSAPIGRYGEEAAFEVLEDFASKFTPIMFSSVE